MVPLIVVKALLNPLPKNFAIPKSAILGMNDSFRSMSYRLESMF
jgi:hypothetical protein